MAQPVFLIGFMGSGKSTLGRVVSKFSGLQFIDLDNFIERRFRANIRDIFARDGEERFREIEHRMLTEISDFENTIIACGGGTPCHFDNMDIMNAKGTTVLLEASEQILHRRLVRGRHKRPLLAGKSDLEILQTIRRDLCIRAPFYGLAAHRFNTDELETREEITRTSLLFINRFALPLLYPPSQP